MAAISKDIISILNKELFTVKFLHSGYGQSRQNFIAGRIQLEPDEKTMRLFIDHSMGYRFYTDTLICFIRTELLSPPVLAPRVPFIKFTGSVLIRFLMKSSTDFLNKTDVIAAGATQVYQFSNQVNIGTGGFISMHATGVNADDLKNVEIVNPARNCFGVIDIHNTGAVNSGYDLFEPGVAQQLKSPAYSIPFTSKI